VAHVTAGVPLSYPALFSDVIIRAGPFNIRGDLVFVFLLGCLCMAVLLFLPDKRNLLLVWPDADIAIKVDYGALRNQSEVIRTHTTPLVGRELEIAWLPPLITQSRNAKIQPGSDGYFDASLTAKILEIPTGQITRAMGDVHPQGNPHYWLDPGNGGATTMGGTAKKRAAGSTCPVRRASAQPRITAISRRDRTTR